MFNCLWQTDANDEAFYTFCANKVGITDVYTREDSIMMAFRIFLLCYDRTITPDAVKIDTLMTLMQPLTGLKIYYDAREALHYVKKGRPNIDVEKKLSTQLTRYSRRRSEQSPLTFWNTVRMNTAGWEAIIEKEKS